MTASRVRALSRRAGALLGAVAVLAAGCAPAAGRSGPGAGRAGTAQATVAATASSRSFARRAARTTGPGSVKHSSGARIAGPPPPFWCEPAMGHPVASPASAAPGSRLVVPVCPCCRCACAWACCGCGPGRWPGWWPRSPLAWLCCARWHRPPADGAAPIPPACGPGCRSFACPAGAARVLVPRPARAAAGSAPERSPGAGSQRLPPQGPGAIIELARHWQAGGVAMEPHPGVFCSNVRTGGVGA
jgi:hypothetical protein